MGANGAAAEPVIRCKTALHQLCPSPFAQRSASHTIHELASLLKALDYSQLHTRALSEAADLKSCLDETVEWTLLPYRYDIRVVVEHRPVFSLLRRISIARLAIADLTHLHALNDVGVGARGKLSPSIPGMQSAVEDLSRFIWAALTSWTPVGHSANTDVASCCRGYLPLLVLG